MDIRKTTTHALAAVSAVVFVYSSAMVFAPDVMAGGTDGYAASTIKVEDGASDAGTASDAVSEAGKPKQDRDGEDGFYGEGRWSGNTEDARREHRNIVFSDNSPDFSSNDVSDDTSNNVSDDTSDDASDGGLEESDGKTYSNSPVLVSDDRWETGVFGDAGRLYLKDFSVALYWGSDQWIVDEEDSAAYWEGDGGFVIAEHHHQGFDIIKTVVPGDICEIRHEDGTCTKYLCTEIDSDCHNITEDLVRSDWATTCYGVADLLMYTCNDCWQNVTCVWWTRI